MDWIASFFKSQMDFVYLISGLAWLNANFPFVQITLDIPVTQAHGFFSFSK